MEHIYINEIKKLEGSPKIVKIFSENEIKMIQELYLALPEKVFNKKQNIRKKAWIQNFNKELDDLYSKKLRDVLGDFKFDTLKSESGDNFFGLFHESFSPLKLHVDSGFDENAIIYKQIVTPLSPIGETIIFKNRWYGKSTSFTIDKEELNFKPGPEQNERSSKHIGAEEFDKDIYNKYLKHENINNLKGLKIESIYTVPIGASIL